MPKRSKIECNYKTEHQLWIATMALWNARISRAHTFAHLFAWLSEYEPETLFTSRGIISSNHEDTRRALTANKWCCIWWNVIELLEEYKKTLEIRSAWGGVLPQYAKTQFFDKYLV